MFLDLKLDMENEGKEMKEINISNSTTKKTNGKDDESSDESKKKNGKKRTRRTNEEIQEKKFKCPYCEKRYTSVPSLNTHKKNKHCKLNDEDKKGKGRPSKETQEKNITLEAFKEFISFFEEEKRKPILSDPANNNDISLDIILQFITNAFNGFKIYSITKYETIEDYPLYTIVKDNWDKEISDIKHESILDSHLIRNLKEKEIKSKTPCVDDLFYLYLKEFSEKTNNNYLNFMVKFIVLFRTNINEQKKQLITKEDNDKNIMEYTQKYSAGEIAELCNGFLLEFMDENQYFGLEEKEVIELVKHFCFWLYQNQYSSSHLSLIN